MMMRTEWREALARAADEEARRDPVAYRRHVLRLVVLNHLYVIGCVLGVALAIPALIAIVLWTKHIGYIQYVIIAELALLWQLVALVRSLLPHKVEETGVVVSAPAGTPLLDEVHGIARQLHVPVREVRVTLEPQASAYSYKGRTVVVVGLPLLAALPRDELRAVIAHEVGHLAHGDDGLGRAVASLYVTWSRLFLADGGVHGKLSWMLLPLRDRLAPKFEACSRAMRRMNERQADARSVTVTGAAPTARALIRVHLLDDEDETNRLLMNEMMKSGKDAMPTRVILERAAQIPADADARLRRALAAVPAPEDTHPGLAERLQLLGAAPELPPPVHVSALDALGLRAAAMEWGAVIDAPLRHVGDDVRKELGVRREQRALLEAKEARSAEEAIELAGILREEDGDAARSRVIALYREALTHKEDRTLRLALGVALMLEERDDEAKLEFDNAGQERATREGATRGLLELARKAGDVAEQRRLKSVLDDLAEEDERALAERNMLRNATHVVDHHGLDAALVERVRAALAGDDKIKAAWLLRYRLKHRVDLPLYLIAVKSKSSRSDAAQAIANRIDLAGREFYVTMDPPHIVKSLPECLLFDRR